MSTILMTGGTGLMGSAMRPRLLAAGHRLRLVARHAPDGPLCDGEEMLAASVTDGPAMHAACQDVDLVVHLGGLSQERDWSSIVEVNITGTHTVLEAAHDAGVDRVLLASSHHAAGCVPVKEAAARGLSAVRPDSYYGVSKVAIEALGSLYADHYGMGIVSARIGTALAAPTTPRHLGTWLSFDDSARLVTACLSAPLGEHHVIWGVSDNTPGWFDLAPGRAIGYRPEDDSFRFADDALLREVQRVGLPVDALLGGDVASDGRALGRPW